jgi:hypothetical protein
MICGWTTFPPMGAEFPWTLTSSSQTPSMPPAVQERTFLSAFENKLVKIEKQKCCNQFILI